MTDRYPGEKTQKKKKRKEKEKEEVRKRRSLKEKKCEDEGIKGSAKNQRNNEKKYGEGEGEKCWS